MSKGTSPTHIAMGKKYLTAFGKWRLYSRGEFYGYQHGVWRVVENIRSEFWNVISAMGSTRPTAGIVSSVIDYVKGQLWVPENKLDALPLHLNLNNGVLDLLTGEETEEHSPDWRFTSQVSYNYDPTAICPRWIRFVNEVLLDNELNAHQPTIRFVQEAFGYSLTAETKHELSFWLVGEGANGKSTMLKVLDALGGSGVLHLNLGLLSQDNYQLALMAGKRVIICTEAPETTVADSTLKSIVSGDPMQVRPIYGRPFLVRPTAKIWWAMNNPPGVNDSSEGFWRKMRVVPFYRSFDYEERDLNLLNKLLAELPGIFNWALVGLKRLDERGFFTESKVIDEATYAFRSESDLPATFINEACLCTPESEVANKDLYRAYRKWCRENGIKRVAASPRLAREWTRLGFRKKRMGNQTHWVGLELISESTPADGIDDMLEAFGRWNGNHETN